MTMSVLAPTVDSGWLARANPVTKLAGCFLLGLGAALTNDPVTPAFILLGALVVLSTGGIGLRALLRRGWPVLVSAIGLGVTTFIFGDSDQPWLTALAVTVRVLAIAGPGIAVVLTINPTHLADSLVQHARVPAKFAYASLAALRLLPLLALEWQTISLARRARGVDAGRNPIAKLRLFASIAFTLLIGAVRRGTRLAMAMDARGFDSAGPRTVARPQAIKRSDIALVIGAVALVGAAVVASSLIGVFRPLWG